MKTANLTWLAAALAATTVAAALATTALAAAGALIQPDGAPAELRQQSAMHWKHPLQTMILGAAHAGKRLVAVGDRGLVLLSDDDGKSYRQARAVPTRVTLTSVSFADATHGWAAGHWGTILRTDDGGESWTLQRDDRDNDQPLHTIWFKDGAHGIAAGLFSLLLTTDDGGKSWVPGKLPVAPGAKRADLNLFRLFPDRQGNVLLAGEQGSVYRSADLGHSWQLLATGNKGTLWAGVVLDDGTIVVGGIQGKLLRSSDGGQHWAAIDSGTKSSITELIELPGGQVQGVALDGVSLLSADRGLSFTRRQRDDQLPLTSVLADSQGRPRMYSQSGVVSGN